MGILGGDGWDDYCSGCERLEKQLDKMEQYADSTRVRYYKLVKMLDEAGVLQLEDEWAVEIQKFIKEKP